MTNIGAQDPSTRARAILQLKLRDGWKPWRSRCSKRRHVGQGTLDSFGVLRPSGASPLYFYRNGSGKVSPTMQSGARNLLSGSARCQRRRRAAFPTGQCVAQRKVGTCHVLHASSNSPVRRQ